MKKHLKRLFLLISILMCSLLTGCVDNMFKDIKFDTSYDINNYQEINDVVFRKLKELCRKYNSTLLVTHHLNKRDETMGSVGLNADVSGIMKLKESKNNYNKIIKK